MEAMSNQLISPDRGEPSNSTSQDETRPAAASNGGISVIDDFLPSDLYEDLARLIAKEPMEYGSRSNSKTDPHGHWTRQFIAAGRYNLADFSDLLESEERLGAVNAAWKFLRDSQLTDSVLIRCYLNGYTYGTDGYFHTDSRRADEHTVVLYMNDQWDPDWAGETTFLDKHGNIAKSVLPKKNRTVIFPSNILHAGRSVSRKCMDLRKTLILKTRKRRSDNFEKLSVFLRREGATNCVHKSGSLHDHLVRTFSSLEMRGFDDEVCFGGGLHSIYGTNIFPNGVMTHQDRSAIIGEFGEGAEYLAYLFSVLDRPMTLESPVDLELDTATVLLRDKSTLLLPRATFDDLRRIECANLADQNSLEKYESLSTLSGLWY
jgi:Rps23 Pro-64 3,4-dihydroxylase Tpa1-like proline 4-hydroxylase